MQTKTCVQCGNVFDKSPIINGKVTFLGNRTLCIICKPINNNLLNRQKENRDLKKESKRKCNRCNVIKDLSEFYLNSTKRQDDYKSNCKECCILQKQKRRKNLVETFKKDLSCSICGYNKCLGAIDFHHLNSDEKEFGVSKLIQQGYSIDKIKEELKKCIVLCANCHRELHYNERQNEIE